MSARRKSLLRSTSGAVAPTVALSLFGLIAAGGIAFDYARMAGLDTELQSAADQAALAAATQLDGTSTAISRATSAAQGLVVNSTVFANDGATSGRTINVPTLTFYSSYDADTDTGVITTSATAAKFVQVSVQPREAFFTLTPIVQMFRSGQIGALAIAGLGSAICKVPPVMICNPSEGSTTSTFPSTADSGKGLLLEAGGGGTWVPGNYGYLNFGGGELDEALGSNSEITNCIASDSVDTKTGNNASVTKAINTRFDIYENGLTNFCSSSTGNCSPAMNVRKDVVHNQFPTGTGTGSGTNNGQGNGNSSGNGNGNGGGGGTGGGSGPNCGFENGTDPWTWPSVQYQPSATTRLQAGSLPPTNMGFPRDICHAISDVGDCQNYNGGMPSRFGNGDWDRSLYFQVNHSGTPLSTAEGWSQRITSTRLTRYDVYRWEIATTGMLGSRVSHTTGTGGNAKIYYSYAAPQCAAGREETTSQKDRRVLTAALVDCVAGGVSGNTRGVKVKGWVDLFLVEPSLPRPDAGGSRTRADQIYVEVIGNATRPGGGDPYQYYSRNKPYLIK